MIDYLKKKTKRIIYTYYSQDWVILKCFICALSTYIYLTSAILSQLELCKCVCLHVLIHIIYHHNKLYFLFVR